MILTHLRTNVVGYLALVIALSGTAYAAIPNGSVTASKIAKAAVTKAKLRDKAVISAKIRDQAVTETKLGDKAVTAAKLAPNSVTSTNVADGSVGRPHLAARRRARGRRRAREHERCERSAAGPPDGPNVVTYGFTMPRATTAYLRMFGARFSVGCSAGSGAGGLDLDGAPLARRDRPLDPGPRERGRRRAGDYRPGQCWRPHAELWGQLPGGQLHRLDVRQRHVHRPGRSVVGVPRSHPATTVDSEKPLRLNRIRSTLVYRLPTTEARW